MKKKYVIRINGREIGHTLLENGDPPMGVVSGKIVVEDRSFGAQYLQSLCESNNAKLNESDDGFVSVREIEGLTVVSPEGRAITGARSMIAGRDDVEFIIDLLGLSEDLYLDEFLHHKQAYDDSFRS